MDRSTYRLRMLVPFFLAVVALKIGINFVHGQSGSRSVPSYSPSRQSPPAEGSGSRVEQSNQSGSGTKMDSSSQKALQDPAIEYDNKLWKYIQESKYQNWGPPGGQSDVARVGQSPHGDKVKVYANRLAVGRVKELPHNSIIIKENYDVTEKQLLAITVMIKSKGYAPKAGDWYWIKYLPTGQVATDGGKRLSGNVTGCIDCHKSAQGNDFVFAND